MYMSLVQRDRVAGNYPELAGTRVVISGLTSSLGIELAEAFAHRNARLIISTADEAAQIALKKKKNLKKASRIEFVDPSKSCIEPPSQFAQRVARTLGSIDTLINLISLSREECSGKKNINEIEDLVVKKFSSAREITEVTANRMALTWCEGIILNALVMFTPQTDGEAGIAGLMKSTLAAMTHNQARRWADSAVRINAIGSKATLYDAMSGACLTSESDLAALAVYLASRQGQNLTGHMFDAEGVSRRGC
ncbi:MAG: SDR family oxidoreductase [Hyphomicrobium sp.]